VFQSGDGRAPSNGSGGCVGHNVRYGRNRATSEEPMIPVLLKRGRSGRVVVRIGTERNAPKAPLSSFDCRTFASAIAPPDTFLQLVGVPRACRPPNRGSSWRSTCDRARQSTPARHIGIGHFVYVSVARRASHEDLSGHPAHGRNGPRAPSHRTAAVAHFRVPGIDGGAHLILCARAVPIYSRTNTPRAGLAVACAIACA
jgi:hypothetical protein